MEGHGEAVISTQFSPDGRSVFVSSLVVVISMLLIERNSQFRFRIISGTSLVDPVTLQLGFGTSILRHHNLLVKVGILQFYTVKLTAVTSKICFIVC